jgi:hypothetical protein
MSGQSPFSSLNRALFWTRAVMIWERLLPVVFPFVLFVLLVAVAAQWGLFLRMSGALHALLLCLGIALAGVASIRGLFRFHPPSFTELNTRLAVDNGLKPERLLAMRHESSQPPLHVGKAKAGIAAADPFALRYVALVAAMMGFLVLGPVPVAQVLDGFCPLSHGHGADDINLAQK